MACKTNYLKQIPSTQRILSYLYRLQKTKDTCYGSQIHKELDITYSHVSKIIVFLMVKGYVKSVNGGRKKFLELSKKGNVLAKACYVIEKECE